jgi:hypothetical protein
VALSAPSAPRARPQTKDGLQLLIFHGTYPQFNHFHPICPELQRSLKAFFGELPDRSTIRTRLVRPTHRRVSWFVIVKFPIATGHGVGIDRTPTISNPVATNNTFQFTLSQASGLSYMIQANTNLDSINWISVATNTAAFTFSDISFTNDSQRYYRVLYRQ